LSENITVRDCMLASGCNAIQFGTETIGDFRNIRFENLRILRAGKAGIGITSNDGSNIDGVHCENITMEQTLVPIFLKVSDSARVPAGSFRRGGIRHVAFANITATDCFSATRNREMPSVIWGKPGSAIEDITFDRVRIVAKGGHPATEAALDPPENDERFPQNLAGLPAYGVYLRHVRNVRFADCQFGFEKVDGRPAMMVDEGDAVSFDGCTLQSGSAETAVATRHGAHVTVSRPAAVRPDL
jgi:polygalacturonase